MTEPKTILELAGRTIPPTPLGDATLVLIDYPNEYVDGPLKLTGVEAAIERAAALLQAARRAGARIIHVAHKGAPGGLFDRTQARGAFIAALAPAEGEAVVEKTFASAFAGTALESLIGAAGSPVVFAGFMTHNCLSSTVRAGIERGYAMTVAADACATRDLPLAGRVVPAADLHAAELAGLADTHAAIRTAAEIAG
ncbi:isochorismatase family protein [Roseiarcus fermentans]|nr:isochorismatase family protein [Roseiarcus fermentans]